MNRRRSAALVSLAGCLLANGVRSAPPENTARELPETVVRDFCKKYSGKSAYTSDGETTHIDCDWIEKMSLLRQPTPIETYRRLLDQVTMLADLRNAKLPDDLDCGTFDEQVVGDSRAIVCNGKLEGSVPYVFLAGPSGLILRMETILDYQDGLRAAMRRSAEKGEISTWYTPFIELNMDIMLAKLRFTATALDSVRIENGRISLVMRASGNF